MKKMVILTLGLLLILTSNIWSQGSKAVSDLSNFEKLVGKKSLIVAESLNKGHVLLEGKIVELKSGYILMDVETISKNPVNMYLLVSLTNLLGSNKVFLPEGPIRFTRKGIMLYLKENCVLLAAERKENGFLRVLFLGFGSKYKARYVRSDVLSSVWVLRSLLESFSIR